MTALKLVASVLLLAGNGFFVAVEFAFVAARPTRLEAAAAEGDFRARAALEATRSLSLQLAGAQLGITMCSLVLGFLAEPTIAGILEHAVEWVAEVPSGVLHTGSFVISLTLVVYFHMTLGEMVPKNIAIAEPERTALSLAPLMRAYMLVFGPAVRLLNGIANLGVRLLGVEPRDELSITYTSDEIASIVADSRAEGVIEEFEGRLVAAVLRFGDRPVSSVMVPADRVTAAPSTATVAEIERLVVSEGHSRILVYGRDLDDAQGFIHAKDLLSVPDDRRDHPPSFELLRFVVRIPANRSLRDVLLGLRRTRIHMAVVTGAEGTTMGVVSLEDLLEELVGEIRDEHDRPERRRLRSLRIATTRSQS